MNAREETHARLFVSGVCCSTEEAVLYKKLDGVVGKGNYLFNPATSELTVQGVRDAGTIIKAIRKAGFDAKTRQELEQPQPFRERHGHAVFTILAACLGGAGIVLDLAEQAETVARILLLTAIVAGGWRVFLNAARALRLGVLDMNVLMSLAVAGALAIDKWAEGAAVIVLFAVSLMLETYSASRTRRAIQSLLTLTPEGGSVLREGQELVVPARSIHPGETIVVRPGERIPLDGEVEKGTSTVSEAPITGEAMPVAKHAGSPVYAGSINQHGALTIRVTRRWNDTTLARIIHSLEQAQTQRAPVQRFVDRFAVVYTPVVLGIAVVVAAAPPLLWGEPFTDWFYRALVLLVIACPCALVISTPVTIVSALTTAARHGVLIKGGVHLETLARLRAIAFDKTGTLTQGRPVVTDIVPVDSLSPDDILTLAAAIELHSEHHLADALLAEAERRSLQYATMQVEGFEAIPGRGVKAEINGTTYYLGNHELYEERQMCSTEIEQHLDHLARDGKTAIVLGTSHGAIGILGIRDAARAQSTSTLRELHALGIRNITMVSGDSIEAAQRIGRDVGIDDTRAALLPDDKVRIVRELNTRHGTVAMVGDGINDAPALAAASVGIAMGVSGTDTALESSDVVLMSDDLRKLPYVIGLSKKALSIVRQNIIIALGLKLVFLILSVTGVATLWMAILADDGAALLVILNGLRVLSFQRPVGRDMRAPDGTVS